MRRPSLPITPRGRALVGGGVGALVLLWFLTGAIGRSSIFGGEPRFRAVEAGTLVADSRLAPPKLDDPLRITTRKAGLRITALGRVGRVHTRHGWRRPYEGSRLIAFRVADGDCVDEPCRSWRNLDARVAVDGDEQPLPGHGTTYAVLAPPGVERVDLRVKADGLTQTISLLHGREGSDRIALLDRPEDERHATINATFALGETTSIALTDGGGPDHDQYVRDVTVDAAELRFFVGDEVPDSARDAFLVLTGSYAYRGRQGRFVFGPGEVRYVDEHGDSHPGIDLDPSPDKTLVGFEVPASTRRGTLLFGGTTQRTSTTGTPYEATLQDFRLPVRFGG